MRDLLASPTYRSLWEPHVKHRYTGSVSQAAVARVLAEHLRQVGERSYDDPDLDRQLKDRVGRALGGGTLTGPTLQWIIDAFDIAESDARSLWADLAPAPRPVRPYRSVTIHELHSVGPDGIPLSHRTLHLIQAIGAPLEHYTYRFDTNVAEVGVLRGGVAGPVYDAGAGLFAVDITLAATLAPGDTASLEYLTTFSYAEPPPPELRRATEGGIDSLELHVRFAPQKLPARLEWATWDHLDGSPRPVTEVALDTEHSAHRVVERFEGGIVGFVWRW